MLGRCQNLWIAALVAVAACHRAPAANAEVQADEADVGEDAEVANLADAASASDALPGDATAAAPIHVLFIGNSYTYVNDLPTMTAQFAHAGGVTIQPTAVTQGGATLAVMIAQTQAVAAIAQGSWTYVVLQGQSVEPAADLSHFLASAKTLAADAAQVGAAVAFYQTWPRKAGDALYGEAWTGGTPQTLAKLLHDGYDKAAVQNGGVRVPVGDAWLLTLTQHPEINLYQDDGSHPVVAGTYLAACVFATTLFHVNPAAVTWAPSELPATQASALRAMCRAATQNP